MLKTYSMNKDRSRFKFAMFSHDVQWGLVAFLLFPITIWFMWIYFIYKFVFYIRTKKVLLKEPRKQAITKRDRRYNRGYRVEGYVNVSHYEWFEANEEDLILNKKKSYIFLLYLIIDIALMFVVFSWNK